MRSSVEYFIHPLRRGPMPRRVRFSEAIMTYTPVTPASADSFGRYDIYKFIHKALRRAQCVMLTRLGACDFNTAEASVHIDELRALLAFGAAHIGHEEHHIHVHLTPRDASATEVLERQHASHRHDFLRLEGLIQQVERAMPEQKAETGHRLYLAFALFIAHDFEHMHEEEAVNNERLWRMFCDDQIMAMERAIVGSLPPEKAMFSLQLMLPAMTPDERAGFLTAMRPAMPPEAFVGIFEHAARPTLTPPEFADLRRRLGFDLSAVA